MCITSTACWTLSLGQARVAELAAGNGGFLLRSPPLHHGLERISPRVEMFATPTARGAREAQLIRQDAGRRLDQVVERLREADRVVRAAALEEAVEQAQGVLKEMFGRRKQAKSAVRMAAQAEDRARGPVQDAWQAHEDAAHAVEVARRTRAGAEIEADASVKVDKLAAILQRHQGELHEATGTRERAEQELSGVEAEIAEAEQVRDALVRAQDPRVRPPLSAETLGVLIRPVTYFLLHPDEMSKEDAALVTVVVDGLAAAAGVKDAVRRQAFADAKKKYDEERKHEPRVGISPDGARMAISPQAPRGAGGIRPR